MSRRLYAIVGVDGLLAIGSANRAYYKAPGVPGSLISDAPYFVDSDRFF